MISLEEQDMTQILIRVICYSIQWILLWLCIIVVATEKTREYFVEDLICELESLCEYSKDNEKLNMDYKAILDYVKKHTTEMANHYPENHVPSRKEVLAYYAEV